MATRHSPDFTLAPPARRLRLQTLVRLRWLAIVGQSLAILVVAFVLGFPLPLRSTAAVIGASVVLNVLLGLRYRPSEGLDTPRAAVLLSFDVLQLAALLYLTGGLQNPFVILFLAPVLISATTLPPVPTTVIGGLVVFCASALALFHLPMPWQADETLRLPLVYLTGVWAAIVLAVGFIGVYAWRVAEEARQQSEALAATELVLQREQHLSALDGLAAAAAHELGTPLATIALIVKEIANAPDLAPAFADDVRILRQQVDRCREILKTLTSLGEEGAPWERMSLAHFLEEVAAPHRDFGIAIEVAASGSGGPAEPVVRRNPGLLYGLGNLVENAVDFARTTVRVEARWDAETVEVRVRDDGPGFPQEVLMHLGEPYVTSRAQPQGGGDESGLGLGVFIAKTLLERSGAVVDFANAPAAGAEVTVRWPRGALEAAAA
jgi:two-component system sensor histidine kinase RegB